MPSTTHRSRRERPSYPVLFFSPSGFPPLMWAAIAEELASHGYVVVGVNHTYETLVTVFTDGRVVQANQTAIAGVLGPQQGPHDAAFKARAAVCDYKAADLRSVADWLVSGGAGRGSKRATASPVAATRSTRSAARAAARS